MNLWLLAAIGFVSGLITRLVVKHVAGLRHRRERLDMLRSIRRLDREFPSSK